MATIRVGRSEGRWLLTAITALAVVAGISARGDEPSAKDAAKAREVFQSLRELQKAVNAHDAASETSGGLPPRPKRTVTPPTLTPAEIDKLMEKHLASSKVPLATPTTDIEFVRRAHLDLTGKLPTPEQVRVFCQAKGKEKRGKLIEYLLNSPEYASNWAHYWRDVIQFHATNQNLNQVRYGGLEKWLGEQFTKNRPWDEIAREMITATGRTDEDNATAFQNAHEAQAVEMAGEVSRVFLGVQIQCAQCHDHPNDSWKRQQFHEFAAFFAGARIRRASAPAPGQPAIFELVAPGKPRYTMPDLKDPQKQIPVAPKFFLGEAPKPLPAGLTAEQRREIAADFVTGQDNPWFAKAFVNRIWYVLMGEGFYNPVDDIGPERTAKAPEVIEAIASQWQKGGYDIRWLFRTIMNTQTYQREIRSTMSASGKVPFASNSPSRLRSDQILDSLAQALNLPMDGPGPNAGATGKKAQAKGNPLVKDLKGAAPKAKGALRGAGGPGRSLFNTLFGVDPSTPYDDILGTIPQALFLMNSPMINNAMRANPNTVLGQILAAHPDNRSAVHALYLRVLAREPTQKELQVLGRYLDHVGNRGEAFEDILWSLINSTEFITRR